MGHVTSKEKKNMLVQKIRNLFVLSLLSLYVASCSDDKTEKIKKLEYMDKFYELKHIEAAPEVVREAAKAVVRINNNATAFFVSNDGLL